MASNDRNATAGIDQHTATVVTTAVRVRRDMAMASTTEMIAAEYSVDTKRNSATIDTDNSDDIFLSSQHINLWQFNNGRIIDFCDIDKYIPL